MASEAGSNVVPQPVAGEPALVTSVARALLAIEWLAAQPAGVGVHLLAEHLQINRGTAYKLLVTLEQLGYVRQLPSAEYELTFRLNVIAANNRRVSDIISMSQPILERLSAMTRETIQLASLNAGHMVFVARAEGPERLKVGASLGDEVVAHCMSSGKLWLASMDPSDRQRAIQNLEPMKSYTAQTITSADALSRECASACRDGYASVVEEYLDGVSSVGVPLQSNGRFVGALTATGPSLRLNRERILKLVPMLQESAAQISSLWIYR